MTQRTPDQVRTEIAQLVQEYADIVYEPKPFVSGDTAVPVSGKVIGAKELQNMVEASLDGWLTTGRFNALFEKRLAKFLGVKHLITVNSGSSANLVAFNTLTSPKLGERAIKPGDEVIGVAAGFPTTVNPILQFGAVPVFVDVDLATHNIDASKIEAAISPKTKAIMLAHSLGNRSIWMWSPLCARSTDYGWWKTAATRWGQPTGGRWWAPLVILPRSAFIPHITSLWGKAGRFSPTTAH